MDFKQLNTFRTVVRLNSFTRAAEELFLSQPTISQHIAQLEAELHTRLIIRTTKSIEITPKGYEVYEYAMNILSLRDRMVEDCSVENQQVLHLGASSIPTGFLLPDVLPGFLAHNPGTRVELEQQDSQTVADLLLTDVIDLGLAGMDPQNEHITAIPFYTDSLVLITPAKEPFLALKNTAADPLALLSREPVILRAEGSGTKKATDLLLKSAGIDESELHVFARVSDHTAIRNLVAAGLGISLLSEKAAREWERDERILIFPCESQQNLRRFYILYRSEYMLKKISRSFIRYLKSCCQDKA